MKMVRNKLQIFWGEKYFFNYLISETEEFLETAITKLEDTAKDKLTVNKLFYDKRIVLDFYQL
jgi:hypothetical protein